MGSEYIMVSSICLQATHLVIYVKKKLSLLVTDIKYDTCATGFKGMMGNKGGVSISFKLHKIEMQFICCHLHSGLDGVAKRNADIKDIMKSLVYPKRDKSST